MTEKALTSVWKFFGHDRMTEPNAPRQRGKISQWPHGSTGNLEQSILLLGKGQEAGLIVRTAASGRCGENRKSEGVIGRKCVKPPPTHGHLVRQNGTQKLGEDNARRVGRASAGQGTCREAIEGHRGKEERQCRKMRMKAASWYATVPFKRTVKVKEKA